MQDGVTELHVALAQYNQENIEIEEFKLLRQEIMYYNEAAFRTELYVVGSCGVIWGWIVANSDRLETQTHLIIACSMPAMLLIAGFVRYMALKYRVARLAFYIYCIESKYFRQGFETAGWEHFVGRTRGNNLVGLQDAANGTIDWRRQAETFKTARFKWAFFSRSANWTWLSVFLLNVSAAFYVAI